VHERDIGVSGKSPDDGVALVAGAPDGVAAADGVAGVESVVL